MRMKKKTMKMKRRRKLNMMRKMKTTTSLKMTVISYRLPRSNFA
mgnify:CR=1 FL=1